MIQAKFFDLTALRRRAKIHEMNERGCDTNEIASKTGVNQKFVRYWLKRSKPLLRRVNRSQEWRDESACLGASTDLFFPSVSGKGAVNAVTEAKRICAGCPVKAQCREAAIDSYETVGVWGGEDFTKVRYRYDDSTGDVYAEIGGRGAPLQKIS